MASFYRASVAQFLSESDGQILSYLAHGYASYGYTSQYTDQTLTWEKDLRSLKLALTESVEKNASAAEWGLLLEFSIPRKEKRVDAVLLIQDQIVILESKSSDLSSAAMQQLEEYALLLHYFHKCSDKHRIVPILVSDNSLIDSMDLNAIRQTEMFPQLAKFWITDVIVSPWSELSSALAETAKGSDGRFELEDWDQSPYFPVPSIIDAAISLRTGLSIREIAHSEASEHEITDVLNTIDGLIESAHQKGQFGICFLTGVPGSGKTLVGLSLAHSKRSKSNLVHFMSGNGPLVKVLQHLFTQESRKKGASSVQARTEARTIIENVHIFARHHMDGDQSAPFNHAIIFDEAQRAWNRAQNQKKFKRDYSEPEMLLGIMERHSDWAFIVALVGGGQEINDGEAGLEEWGKALAQREKPWLIYASPEVLQGGPSTAGHRLFEQDSTQYPPLPIHESPMLHLRTSNRSLRAENLAKWVNFVIAGEAESAGSLHITDSFPVFLSRDLDQTRRMLQKQGIGENRYGLVGSSAAARLRAEGLEPNSSFHADFSWEHWYLAGRDDLRSSFRCEVFATEFEIQGLELDWIGLCWGGDFIWQYGSGWQLRTIRLGPQAKWNQIKNPARRIFRQNAYRVLLTRARQGMVLFVPPGSPNDPTNSSIDFDQTADFLISCGVIPLQI
jgi:Schlafen group 3, DNA/RNA helicase domain